ncbi:MAG: MFS transporter [Bacteroidetes bacterium]|nr:MFS transporter [Fibrella sp.]
MPPAKASKRDWIGLAVIALPCLLYSMDLTVLNLAVPYLSIALKPSASQLLWILDIYGFILAGFLITMGTLGDRIGRRKVLLMGACAFGVASIFAAYANSSTTLIIARAILGIAGATLAPSTLSLIQNMFADPRQRRLAIGIWVASFSAGGAIGPIVGGVLLAQFGWGSVFLISVPVMTILLLAGPFLLPEFKDANARPVDIVSVVISLLSILTIVFGLKQTAANGMNWLSASSIAVGLLTGVFFLRRQKKLPFPLVDLELFHRSSFRAALLIYTFGTFVLFGFFFFTYQYLQLVVGFAPIKAGLWSLPNIAAFIIGSITTPAIAAKVHPIKLITAGLFMAALGFGLVTQLNGEAGLWFLVVGSFIYCLGIAPIITLTTDMIVSAVPAEKAGMASALAETGSEFGGALGIALLGTLGTAIYRSQLAKEITVIGSTKPLKAVPQTLAEAIQYARTLPANLRDLFIQQAHQAFIKGMQLTALTCGIIALIMAVVCLTKRDRI